MRRPKAIHRQLLWSAQTPAAVMLAPTAMLPLFFQDEELFGVTSTTKMGMPMYKEDQELTGTLVLDCMIDDARKHGDKKLVKKLIAAYNEAARYKVSSVSFRPVSLIFFSCVFFFTLGRAAPHRLSPGLLPSPSQARGHLGGDDDDGELVRGRRAAGARAAQVGAGRAGALRQLMGLVGPGHHRGEQPPIK